MRNTALLLLLSCILSGCQESLEDRCAREAREYTEKKCPSPIAPNMVIDSMAFDRSTHTLNYFYTIDDAGNDAVINRQEAYDLLLGQIRNATSIREYKKAGFNFAYTYRSAKDKGKVLFRATFTSKDYQ